MRPLNIYAEKSTGKKAGNVNLAKLRLPIINKFRDFLYKYKLAIIILYIPVYIIWFILLEQRTDIVFKDMHCIVDDWIPFCEAFIIPYFLWFAYVAVSLIYLFFQTKHIDNFYKCATMLLLGMTTCLIIYTLFPNAQSMRPLSFERDNIFIQVIEILYSTDTDTNVCPSIHVYNSIVIHVAILKCYALKNKKIIRMCSFVLCVLICMSTLFLKQHSFVDLVCAVLLYIACYTVIYKPFAGQKLQRIKQV